jgi:DMSO/TMAO reductase YedYZ molybdopterin-dependent catalytic subunit
MAMPAITRARGAAAGVLAGGVALGIGELVAGIGRSRRSPVIAVGDLVIDAVPRPVKDEAIRLFGTHDKLALLVGIYVVIALIAAVLGMRAMRRFSAGAFGMAVFGALGVFAATQEVGVSFDELIASVIGAACGIGVLWLLVGAATVTAPESAPAADGTPLERRRFLVMAGGAVVVGAGAASIGRALQGRVSVAASRLAVVLPRPIRPAAAVPATARLDVDGISPLLTPNRDFYRIDVNLLVPQVSADGWKLDVKGRVERPFAITYDELLAMPMEEHDVTLACVSNEVGGHLISTARWLGTPLLALLERAGIAATADQVVARSVDGFTTGFPVDAVRDGRTALLAVGMNGEPLPARHGFPARLVIAGLYGYVSATKWLRQLEVTRFDEYDTYWIQRGWSALGPVKVQSRIDTPHGGRRVAAGTVPIAGVAWAQHTGVSRVEVRVDDGAWVDAELADALSVDTWRQWVHRWDATPGKHDIAVRATDAHGMVQPEERAEPYPDGATGWHTITVDVAKH